MAFIFTALLTFPFFSLAQFNTIPHGTNLPSASASSITSNLMLWILVIVGFIGVIGFAISGIFYVVAFGDKDMLIRAKKSMKFSVIGIIVSISGLVFLQISRVMIQSSNVNYSENINSQFGTQGSSDLHSLNSSSSKFPIAEKSSTSKTSAENDAASSDIATNLNGDRQFTNPLQFGEIRSNILSVNNVALISFSDGTKKLILSGIGLPNTNVFIYIFSKLPLILSTVTDSNGSWSYVLDNQIADGEHQVYVAVTDSNGKITAKSEPLFFVKTAEAITLIPSSEAGMFEKSIPPLKKRLASDMLMLSGIIVLGFILCLSIMGSIIIKRTDKKKGLE